MSLVIRSSRKAGFSLWLGFSSSIMDWITSSVSLSSCINFFILIACASDGVASLYSIASSRVYCCSSGGLAGNPEICEENADYEAFVAALTAIAEHMCAEHAGDGEGATHLITCEVTHAPDLKTARAVSRSVVCSNLFKAAVFGRDANWGRILCAIGYTPGDFSIDKVCVWLSSAAGEVYVCENAAYHPYSEDEAAKVLAEHDVLVKVDMGTGDASAKAWGCDLTYDYVKINGDYRT